MRLFSKWTYLGLVSTLAAAAIGFMAGGTDLMLYAGFTGGLICTVGLLWIEIHRLRRAQAARTNRIAKRITLLERQTSLVEKLLSTQQRDLFGRLDAIEETQLKALKSAVSEVLTAQAADAAHRTRELGATAQELATAQAERVLDAITERAKKSTAESARDFQRIGREESRALYKKVDSLVALYRDIEPRHSLPAMHSWAITPDFARVLYLEVIENERTQIVECGSGSTTVILAYALRALGKGRVYSLEHEAEFVEATRRTLAEHGLSEWAEVIHAPLVDVDIDGTSWRWYDPSTVPDGTIDLLLVDGPPGPTGPLARYPAMPVLADRLSPDAVIMLDDADRDEERAIKKRWMSEFEGYRAKMLKTDCGALVMRPIAKSDDF